MKILAVEFSSEQRSVAVAVGGVVRGTSVEHATRTTPAFALIEKTLAEAKVEREAIECIAIGLGPGSYTGIRAAIAIAQGWQLALPVSLLGISSMDCLAAEAQAKGWFGKINLIVDAQRNELYFARYEISASQIRALSTLKLATPDEVVSQSSADEIVAGPDADHWSKNGRVLFPSATALAQLATPRMDFLPGEKLEPIYLRETNFVKAPAPRIPPAG